MQIQIDMENPEPMYAQLVRQVKEAVKKEAIQPGDALPSIRQLANDLELNSKTVAKAYRLLERDQVIQTRGYRGTFVHPEASSHCTIDVATEIRGVLQKTLEAMRNAGATDSEIRIAFNDLMNQTR
ncbi:MAG TPA: GntR family transcriptional regulator [Xanthomonadales bacterium]|nr:GntR family transcriptional regulator [Xanthomonadales bacterium]